MGFELHKTGDDKAWGYTLGVNRDKGRIRIDVDTEVKGRTGVRYYAHYPLTREEALALAAHLTGLASTILRDQEEAARK